MVGNWGAHERCGGRNQGFRHLDEAILVDAFGQLLRKELRERFALVKTYPLENLVDQLISVGQVSVCRGVLSEASHLLRISDKSTLTGSPG